MLRFSESAEWYQHGKGGYHFPTRTGQEAATAVFLWRHTGFLKEASLQGADQLFDQVEGLVGMVASSKSRCQLEQAFPAANLLLAVASLSEIQIPLTSSGVVMCQFIASRLPVQPQETVGYNAARRGSSVICVVHWPQFIRFVDSDSHLSQLMGLSVQPFCIHFPLDLVSSFYDERAHSLRTDADGNKDRCLLSCQ